ncbi:sugar phosphate isomerase/epimerase [Pontibacter saemangeumensis]|uniref:Sugar phosphate isomerase/epimerase n=1 Tax=Pontibacter saemangeumensis TaxID=1084525 RepID=A0ABP8M5M0_9BACT
MTRIKEKDHMKKLLLLLSLLCALFVGQGSVTAQKGKPLFPQTPGMAAYTYRYSFPKGIEATLDTIQALGITELEVGVNAFGLAPDSLRQLLDARGMTAPSVGVGYEQLVKDPQEVARVAKILGAKYVMVAWIPHQGDNFTVEDARKAVADFNRAGKVLKENGLTFNYHIHGYEMRPYQNGTLFDYIAKNTDPEYVSFTMDMLWAYHGGQDPAKLLLKYPNRWTTMHLKDLKKGVKGDFTGGTPVENDVALGEGQLDIPAILKAAKKVGIKHYFIEDESPRVITQVPVTMAYLKSLKE